MTDVLRALLRTGVIAVMLAGLYGCMGLRPPGPILLQEGPVAPESEPPAYWSVNGRTFCDPKDPKQVVVVASWNIHKRRLATRRAANAFATFETVVKGLNADLLFIQESTEDADEVEQLRKDLGANYKLLLGEKAGRERLAAIYNDTVLEVEPAPAAGSDERVDVQLLKAAKPQDQMFRQPLVVYARVRGQSPTPKFPFSAVFLNVHTRPRAANIELDKVSANYNAVVADQAARRNAAIQHGHQPKGRDGELDVIIIGDLNAAPEDRVMQRFLGKVFPALRAAAGDPRITAKTGTLIQSGDLADNLLFGDPTFEDFIRADVVDFDHAPGAHSPASDVSDHRPIRGFFCKYNDSE